MNPPSTVLIVDDLESGRKLLGYLLKPDGYRLEFASNGKEALALAAQIEPDVILLDVMMPDMDGFQVCQVIRTTPALAEIPIVMVTGLEDHDARLHGLEVGADDFITKPYNGSELSARVRTITRLNRHRRLITERAKFEWAIANARDGYLILDADDCIQYANAQARQYLRLMPDSLGMPFWESIAPWYQREPADAWTNWNVPSPSAIRYLIQPETSQSKAFWLRVDILTLPLQTDSQRLVCLRNVSEEVAPSRFQTSYGETLVHKMHTPLQVVLGSLELVLSKNARLDPDKISDLLESAYAGAKRMYTQTESLIRYLTTPPYASPDNAFQMAQLPPLVEQFANQLEILSPQVVLASEINIRSLVLSQPAMETILWQVLENAKKFHPTHKPFVKVAAILENDHAVIRIIDDGVTLTPEQLSQVWTPYYQAEKNFTGQVAGMGLGLAMVASQIWTVGGTCVMYNRHDRSGVIVEFKLPLKSEKKSVEPSADTN